jgi:hypothetical protein
MSTSEHHALFFTPEITAVVRDVSERFSASILVRHCRESIFREEDPRCVRARQEGVCSLVHAPRCEAKRCLAKLARYCRGCYATQQMWACETCFGFRSLRRLCFTCWRVCHAGHVGVEIFTPGSCDCTNKSCKHSQTTIKSTSPSLL